MSLGSSDMAGSAVGTASCLLLLASVIQGLQDKVFYHEKIEALVDQNVTLPCNVKNTDLLVVSVEWRKMASETTKLALYSPRFGKNNFWPNVTIQTENKSLGSLQLSRVSKWDSGVYVCELTTFPLGSMIRETQLEVKDIEITCDAKSPVEVHAGGNVSIHCSLFPKAQYSWTKDKKLVSGNESLVLWQVTEAHTGVYTLAVNTGAESVYKEFIITVLTETTSLSTDLVTVSPQYNQTETGLTQTTDSNFITSTTPGISTINTASTMRDFTPYQPSNGTTTSPNDTLTTTTTTDPRHFNSSTYQKLNTSTLSDQSAATTLSYDSRMFSPTRETRNDSRGGVTKSAGYPGPTPTQSTRNTTVSIESEDTAGARSHLVVLIIVLLLVLIALAGFLYRRHTIKQRMDLPPPFKPPPPPVKYTAARQREINSRHYPTSRCNSVSTELEVV